MFDVKINFSPAYMDKVNSKNYAKVIEETLADTAIAAESITKKEAPVKTGTLRRSIGFFTKGSIMSGVKTNVKYWLAVEYGTKPHKITPKNKKFLAWKEAGSWHFAKEVNHPGTEANPFVKRSLNKIKTQNIPAIALAKSLKKNLGDY